MSGPVQFTFGNAIQKHAGATSADAAVVEDEVETPVQPVKRPVLSKSRGDVAKPINVLKLAKERLKVVKRELKQKAELEKEKAELERIIAAAEPKPAKVVAIVKPASAG